MDGMARANVLGTLEHAFAERDVDEEARMAAIAQILALRPPSSEEEIQRIAMRLTEPVRSSETP